MSDIDLTCEDDMDEILAERDRVDRLSEHGSCWADPLKASREYALEEGYAPPTAYKPPPARGPVKLVPPANETRQLRQTVDELRKRLQAVNEAVLEHKAAKAEESVGNLGKNHPDLVLWRAVREQVEAA